MKQVVKLAKPLPSKCFSAEVKSIKQVVTVDVTPKARRLHIVRCSREDLKRKTNTPESTLIRYLDFAGKHIPEFGYMPNQTEFDDFQEFTIAWLRNLYSQGKRKTDILRRLHNGELLDEYQEAVKDRTQTRVCDSN